MTSAVHQPPAAGGPGAAPAFAVEDVTVRFGGLTALDAVSLELGAREVHGVIGPNGAGKTTLLNVCCGFQRPDSGTLSRAGRPLAALAPHQLVDLGIARTLQGVGLFRGLTALENVMVGADRHRRAGFLAALLGLPRAEADRRALAERARSALAEVGAADVADRLPAALPYPVRKRVALARALVAEPEILFLDEPAGGLGSDDIDELAGLIRRLAERATVVLVEHHMDLVMAVCDRITVLDFGRVIAVGDPAAVQDDPAVAAAYLGEESARGDEGGTA
ncbi:ABC transporter ATP-binding protein [Actinomycetospora cinnamomea]|uniref:Branched-chain amino acid transport system ATP-binding protein n=1 Tax=Actinomycetospora cinnamomea TaxID=663609 RepID=A0A2U1EC75_9PSEU|nr:ABC transporter ATP-binding protein [Actinomycetospora cinnamomea]PVY97485.1 branched-chain amino acid transport system ATP-binding protein [Actinomycetospora cinnamomea]